MRAAVLSEVKQPLRIVTDYAKPAPEPGHVLLRVRACGVCRTDLHITQGELAPHRRDLIPGHQIVGEVVGGATRDIPVGMRVGVCWLGGTDGACSYCQRGLENLCDTPTFTGYSVPGGYAECALAQVRIRAAVLPLPQEMITADDITNGKPDPEPYLKASSKLGFRPSECVVLEDVPAGIAAGKAAGAKVIAFTTTVQEALLRAAGADWILKNCADLSVRSSGAMQPRKTGSESNLTLVFRGSSLSRS